ncbi:MAG: helix-turn-helix domain-containing protein [Clostridia bacterium]|jgi:transcriptional regulator with XRE-family HTH domain|nr:helix-turn-helix domain-containing protein [Clostridia bacterium]
MSREYIASVLKRLREASGLTADQVGEMVGKSGKTVNAWENNRGQPDAEILMLLCEIYGVEDVLATFKEGYKTKKAPAAERSESDNRKKRLISNYDKLNDFGKDRLVEHSDDMTTNEKYTQTDIGSAAKEA